MAPNKNTTVRATSPAPFRSLQHGVTELDLLEEPLCERFGEWLTVELERLIDSQSKFITRDSLRRSLR